MTFFSFSKQLAVLLISNGVAVALVYCQSVSAAFVKPTRSQQAMVVSAHPLATEVGIEILRRGGNAVDAAVATAFAISVVEPFSAGIGGGGFLLLYGRLAGTSSPQMKALDFRERAPQLATRDMYLDEAGKPRPEASVNGHLAVAVPGTVAGLYEVQRQYGKLSWQETVAPSIQLARQGFIVSDRLSFAFKFRQQAILKNPAARAIFTKNGVLYTPGERLIQTDLGETLSAIAQDPQSFYTGKIATAIAKDMAANGGLISLADLKAYKPIWRKPVCGQFRQAQICSMPPPSSGGVHLLEILNIIGATDLKTLGWHHPDALHLIVEAMKIAYNDRAEYLGDPDFVDVPTAALINPDYAVKRRTEISLQQARSAAEIKPLDRETLQQFNSETPRSAIPSVISTASGETRAESPDTTHLTVVDAQRNAVSMTFTINGGFGSAAVVPGTGILLNNEMDDFAIAPNQPNIYGLVGNSANAIAPGKTPLSSMTPVIVTEKDQLRLIAGAPGGSTIITTVLQILLNVLEYDMDAGSAVAAPRLHHQWLPDKLRVEHWGFDAATLEELRRRGHQIEEQSGWGNGNLILLTPDGKLEGAADPRGEGTALGF